MNQLFINKEQVTAITVAGKKLSKRYIYKESEPIKQGWWSRVRKKPIEFTKEGFYEQGVYTGWSIGEALVTREEILKESQCYEVEDKKVWIKNEIKIRTSDDRCTTLYFDSKEEAKTFLNVHFNERKYLELTKYINNE